MPLCWSKKEDTFLGQAASGHYLCHSHLEVSLAFPECGFHLLLSPLSQERHYENNMQPCWSDPQAEPLALLGSIIEGKSSVLSVWFCLPKIQVCIAFQSWIHLPPLLLSESIIILTRLISILCSACSHQTQVLLEHGQCTLINYDQQLCSDFLPTVIWFRKQNVVSVTSPDSMD